MNNVVSVRIDKINYTQTLGQLSHDIRKEVPDYLRRDESNKIYFFEDDDSIPKTIKFSKDDTDISATTNDKIINKIDNIQKDIQEDFKKHRGKKLDLI